MRTRFMTTLIMVASLLVGGQALAQPVQTQISDFQSGQVLRARELNAIVRQLNNNTNALNRERGTTHTVDCSSETIADAMSQAQPGDTIAITGTCNETVMVDKDGITLDGGGTAIIDGSGAEAPVIAVYGHQNVVIKGLTVRNGQYGVLADRGAAVWLEDVTARDNGSGISIQGNSSATFAGAIMSNDNDIDTGIEVRQSSIAAVDVTLVQASRNAVSGISLHRGAQMLLADASKVEVIGNGGFTGILCYLDCSLSIVATRGVATSLQVTNNGAGIWISNGAQVVLEGVDLAATGNTGHGLFVGGASGIETYGGFTYADSVVPTGTVVFNNNGGNGVSLSRNSHAVFSDGGVTISNNGGDGISGWNGVDVDLNNATITGNAGEDIVMSLGSRLGWGGDTTVGTVACYDSVLTYNDAACPVATVPDDSDQ